ncbi:MAG: hypothetical protein ACOH2T_18950 [Pseudomonas sp.]
MISVICIGVARILNVEIDEAHYWLAIAELAIESFVVLAYLSL